MAVILFRRSEGASPLSLNLFKNSVAIGLLALTMAALGTKIPLDRSMEDWARVAASGVLGLAVADTLLFAALARIGAGRLAAVDTIYAPMVVLLSWVFLGERPGLSFAIGAGVVLLGVTVANLDPAHLRGDGGRKVLVGTLLAVGAISGTATGVILARPVLVESDLVEITFSRLIFGSAAQLLFAGVTGRLRDIFSAFKPGPLWRTMVPGAVIGTWLSLLFWLGGFKWAPAGVAAVLNQMATVYILILARVVLKEHLSPRQWLGAGLAAVGALGIVLARS